MSDRFQILKERSNEHREDNDCTVKCLALMLGTSYEDAWNRCKAWGRKEREGFNLMKHFPELEENGLTVTTQHRPAKTVKTFQRLGLRGRYAVHTTSHILYYEDGVVHDWSDSRQLRILAVFKIEGTVDRSTINPECSELNHDYHSRVALARAKRTRKTGYLWKMIRLDTGETIKKYKRRPNKEIEMVYSGAYSHKEGAQLQIRQIHQMGGKPYEAITGPKAGEGLRWGNVVSTWHHD